MNRFEEETNSIVFICSKLGYSFQPLAGKIEKDYVWVPGGGGFHNYSEADEQDQIWHYKWHEMSRWRERVSVIEKLDDNNIEDAVDFLHAFTLNCFHLKDYLEASLKTKLNSENCPLFKFPEFLICRDIANGLKHLELSRPSISELAAFYREYDYFNKEHKIKVSVYIQKQLFTFDHVEFVNRCAALWWGYLQTLKLVKEGYGD